MSSSRHHVLAISPAIKNYRVGDNRRTVNTSTTPHISDQLGTENACETLLCWFIVMIRILVCNNMYQYQHRFWSFYHNLRQFRFIVGKWVNTGYFFFFFFLIQQQGITVTDVWKSNVKNIFHIISHVDLSECLGQTTWYSSFHSPCTQPAIGATKHPRQNAYLTAMFGHYIGGYSNNKLRRLSQIDCIAMLIKQHRWRHEYSYFPITANEVPVYCVYQS